MVELLVAAITPEERRGFLVNARELRSRDLEVFG